MSLLLASLVVVTFAVTIERLDLASRAREVGTRAGDCLRVLRDPALDDGAKERALRRQALHLFRLLGFLVGGSLFALLLPLFGVWLLGRAGVVEFDAVVSVLERVDFLVAATVLGALTYLVLRRFDRA